MSHEGYHEPVGELSAGARDLHRAIESLMEELEAMDWYHQRIECCQDEELRAILVHNRDEETEHAVMLMEWLRRKNPKFAEEVAKRIGRDGPIAKE
jgi:ferritin-like protein